MNAPSSIQYTTAAQIVPMPENDRLAFKETFGVTRGDHTRTITFCHPLAAAKGVVKPGYEGFFNRFLQVNERFIPEGSVAIDIGAYDGDTTLPIAFLCGATGKTYAFECGESFMSQLSINVGMNLGLNIEAIPAALMSESGIYEFNYCSSDYNGGHCSTNNWVGTYNAKRLVRAISWAEFSKGRDLSRLAFIKVDTEGHDFHILWSFRETIKALRPVIHAEWFPDTDSYIAETLTYLGYSLFCGFTLDPLTIGVSSWRQDIIMVPTERLSTYGLEHPGL